MAWNKIRSALSAVILLTAFLFTSAAFSLPVYASETETAEESTKEDASDTETNEDTGSESSDESGSADTAAVTEDSDADDDAALTPEGNLTLVDDIVTSDGKEFLTVVTKSGNYFYLIIDRDDEGESTVYFLNQVDEYDLTALMSDEELEAYEEDLEAAESEAEASLEEAENAASASEGETSETGSGSADETQESKSSSGWQGSYRLILILLFLAGIGAVGIFLYKKVSDGGKQTGAKSDAPDPDDAYEDEIYDLPEDTDYTEEEPAGPEE